MYIRDLVTVIRTSSKEMHPFYAHWNQPVAGIINKTQTMHDEKQSKQNQLLKHPLPTASNAAIANNPDRQLKETQGYKNRTVVIHEACR